MNGPSRPSQQLGAVPGTPAGVPGCEGLEPEDFKKIFSWVFHYDSNLPEVLELAMQANYEATGEPTNYAGEE